MAAVYKNQTNKHAKRWIKWPAKAGYASRGVIYLMIGSLALAVSVGFAGGEVTGARGALASLLGEPFGRTALLVLAAGLICYSAWRATQVVIDVDDHGHDAKGLAIRAGLACSAITHTGLAFYAFTLALGDWSQSGSSSWTAQVVALPWGRWLLGTAGLVIVGVGMAHFNKAYRAGFEKYFGVDWNQHGPLREICRFGLAARGMVFVLLGGTVIAAAWRADVEAEQGTEGVLEMLHGSALGDILLGIMALGLFAFGIYSLLEARYRRVGLD